jgi:hypothetical protein
VGFKHAGALTAAKKISCEKTTEEFFILSDRGIDYSRESRNNRCIGGNTNRQILGGNTSGGIQVEMKLE